MSRTRRAADLLRTIAPEIARSGVLFALPPERLRPAPWLGPRQAPDELVRHLWTYGLATPLVGRQTNEGAEILAEPEFLDAARSARLPTVQILTVDATDALGRALAFAAERPGSVDGESRTRLHALLRAADIADPDAAIARLDTDHD